MTALDATLEALAETLDEALSCGGSHDCPKCRSSHGWNDEQAILAALCAAAAAQRAECARVCRERAAKRCVHDRLPWECGTYCNACTGEAEACAAACEAAR